MKKNLTCVAFMNPGRWTARSLMLPVAVGVAIGVSACGGGGSGSADASTEANSGTGSTTGSAAGSVTLGGTAYDSAIPGAMITITSGAPLGQSGATTIATAVANASGVYTMKTPIPSGNTSVFINAADPRNANNVFVGYLGQSTDLVSGATLDDDLLPNLDVGPVTTAAVALYASLHSNSYASITRASYTQA
jgi:hypothetical protein